jgi:DNA (cytosine-5)-methyltransferase 1
MAGNREKDWGKLKHFREGQAKQVLDDLFFDYLALVERLKPKVCIAENVKGMIQGKAKGYVKMIFQRFKEIGYRPQLFLVNAADCGVPQKRERVFFVALRNDIVKPKLILNPSHRWISAGEATSDLQVLTDEEVRETKMTPIHQKYYSEWENGDSLANFYEKRGEKARSFSEIKLSSLLPSNALTSHPSHYAHWNYPRYLTYREWKRLGSFPDDYRAKTPKIGKYIIGMSVPPFMMREVARAVIEQWLN